MSTLMQSTINVRQEYQVVLDQLEPLVAAAVQFAEQWDAEYRPHILQLALSRLAATGAAGGDGAEHVPVERKGQSASLPSPSEVTPVSAVAKSIGVDADLLRRVVHIEADGKIVILGRVDGDSIRRLQNTYAAIYAFVKEKAFGEMHVGVEELRQLCKSRGCYDSANFTANFRRDDLLREIKDGNSRQYVATKKGVDVAVKTLRELAEG
ncbi:MAG TPA: hypothetical protein VF212_03920 [Longimicrobiales bacterium]